MADAAEARPARPSRTGTVHTAHFKAAEKKYRDWNKPETQTEFKRLYAIDKQTKMTSTSHPYEHAVFIQLCILKEGNNHHLYIGNFVSEFVVELRRGQESKGKGNGASSIRFQGS